MYNFPKVKKKKAADLAIRRRRAHHSQWSWSAVHHPSHRACEIVPLVDKDKTMNRKTDWTTILPGWRTNHIKQLKRMFLGVFWSRWSSTVSTVQILYNNPSFMGVSHYCTKTTHVLIINLSTLDVLNWGKQMIILTT